MFNLNQFTIEELKEMLETEKMLRGCELSSPELTEDIQKELKKKGENVGE